MDKLTFNDIFIKPDLSNLARLKTEWLIDRVLPVQSIGMLYGKSGIGKSFIALSLACSVAVGVSWFGHNVKQGKVLYFAGEGQQGLAKRIKAFAIDNDIDDSILEENFNILNTSKTGLVRISENPRGNDIMSFPSLLNILDTEGIKPALVVIDTVNNFNAGADENDATRTAEFTNASRRFADKFGSAVIFVHHSGKQNNNETSMTNSYRGSSAFESNADFVYSVSKNDEVIKLNNLKMKEAPLIPAIGFKLKEINIAGMEEGSCVLECSDIPVEKQRQMKLSNKLISKIQIIVNFCEHGNFGMAYGGNGYIFKDELRSYLITLKWERSKINQYLMPTEGSRLIGALIKNKQLETTSNFNGHEAFKIVIDSELDKLIKEKNETSKSSNNSNSDILE